MSDRDKKKKAAMMAVMAYLEEERHKKTVNHWTVSGRQIIMQNRQMAQTKLYK